MGPVPRTITLALAVPLAWQGLAACGESSFGPPDEIREAGPDAVGDAGSDSGEDAGDAAASCNLPGVYGKPACMRCMAERCCAQVTACENDPACKGLQHCTLDCQGTVEAKRCYEGCLQTYADGGSLWTPVYDCWTTPSATLCYTDCTRVVD